MEYYPPYSKESREEYSGIFEYISGESHGIVDGKEVENNRALNGDIVRVSDSRVVDVKTRNDKLIIGILHLNTNQKYGFTKKKVPYIKFTSCCGKYPSFIVPCKKRQTIAMYVAIRFNRWDTNNKHPIGQIEHYIGNVGDNASETDMLLYLSGIYPKKIKRTFYDEVLMHTGVDYRTFSIDPKGCRDIDDAFHLERNGEKVEIGIHIANVARHLESITTNLYSTIYLENGQINMLDDKHTFQKCSLGNGERKLALSLILEYSCSSEDKLLNYYFKESVVVNTSYAYTDSNNKIGTLLEFTKNITGKMEMNSCEMVEYFMILYNSKVAEKLYKSDAKSETILRTHTLTNTDSFSSDSILNKYLELSGMQAAEYCIEPKNTTHQSLSLEYYTHATSPIRRFVDIINQHMIISQIDSSYSWNRDNYSLEISEINKFGKYLRKFYNNYKKLKLIHSPIKYENLDAYIIKIKNHRVKIYIPSLEITYNFELVASRLLNAADIDFRVVENSDGVSQEAHLNGKSYSLYDKIKINITQLKYENVFNKKLKITVI